MMYLYLKALHLIFIVTWFAGLFYIVRLFVYHLEALEKTNDSTAELISQYTLMERRLWYGITWPSAAITLLLGTALLFQNPELLHAGFMHLKFFLLFLLFGYHSTCHYILVKLQNNASGLTSMQMRWWNEVATILLFAIVFVIVLKDALNGIFATIALLGLIAILTLGIVAYKRKRNRKNPTHGN
jgi:putative membrane protein